jgi:hypothetical protein
MFSFASLSSKYEHHTVILGPIKGDFGRLLAGEWRADCINRTHPSLPIDNTSNTADGKLTLYYLLLPSHFISLLSFFNTLLKLKHNSLLS